MNCIVSEKFNSSNDLLAAMETWSLTYNQPINSSNYYVAVIYYRKKNYRIVHKDAVKKSVNSFSIRE